MSQISPSYCDGLELRIKELGFELAAMRIEKARLFEACKLLRRALSEIDYICGEPNEMHLSNYDADFDEKRVVAAARAMRERAERAEAQLVALREQAAIAAWSFLMDWCTSRKINPSEHNGLFALCGKLRDLALDSPDSARQFDNSERWEYWRSNFRGVFVCVLEKGKPMQLRFDPAPPLPNETESMVDAAIDAARRKA